MIISTKLKPYPRQSSLLNKSGTFGCVCLRISPTVSRPSKFLRKNFVAHNVLPAYMQLMQPNSTRAVVWRVGVVLVFGLAVST
jgi:hypothetical protein